MGQEGKGVSVALCPKREGLHVRLPLSVLAMRKSLPRGVGNVGQGLTWHRRTKKRVGLGEAPNGSRMQIITSLPSNKIMHRGSGRYESGERLGLLVSLAWA